MSFWRYTYDIPVHVPGIETFGLDEARTGCGDWREGWGCTRPMGHAGRHIATAGMTRVFAAWPGDHEPTVADLTGEA